MICEKNTKQFCCQDISLIETYEIAVSSPEKYECHHRLETHSSDGERRLVDLIVAELIALDMYYHRPASELIFLPHSQHTALHMKGKPKPKSEEWRRKVAESHKGKPSGWKGKKHSEETRRRIAEAHKGKPRSEETRKKIAEARKGKHWKLVDGKRVWY